MLCGYTPFWDSGNAMKIYENIIRGKVRYPEYIHPDARNLLERLITADITKRLGNLYGGPADVKGHPWFSEVTWERLERKDIDAPYTPPVKAGVGDTSLFDRYPEETERYGQTGADEYVYPPFPSITLHLFPLSFPCPSCFYYCSLSHSRRYTRRNTFTNAPF